MEHTNPSNSSPEQKDLIQNFFESFNIKLFLYIAKRTILFVSILLLLSVLIPFLILRYSTPIYETKATLIKKKEIKNSILDEKNTEFLKSNDEEKINRDIQVIKSDFLLDYIVDSLNLNIAYFKKGRIPNKRFELAKNSIFEIQNYEIYNPNLYNQEIEVILNNNKYDIEYKSHGEEISIKNLNPNSTLKNKDLSININILNPKIEGKYIVKIQSKEYIKNYVLGNLQVVNNVPNIHFSIKSNNAEKSEYIISQTLKGFLDLDQKENSEKVENSLRYIKNFIDTLNLQLRVSQQEKTNYVKLNSVYDPGMQLQSNLVEVEEVHNKLDELNAKLYSFNKLKTQISSSDGKLVTENAADDKELQSMIIERNKLLVDYTPTHSTVVMINKSIKDRIHQMNNGLKNEIEDYQNRIQIFKQRKSQAQTNLSSLPEKDMEFNKIQKEVEIKEKYVIDLIEKQIQYLIIKSSISSDYLIIQPAKTNPNQISPKKGLLYGTSIILFLLTTIATILYRYIKFDKIVSVDDVKKNTQIPILGYIPFVEEAFDEENDKKKAPESRIVVINNPKSRISEVFKKMRASLKYTAHHDYKTVASTSTISGEGKTFVLLNLAAVHALLDKKVLVIDLDLRKPRISKSLKLHNSKGMSNLLTSEEYSIDDCIQKYSELSNLDVITSGPIPPNPSELIISDKFDILLEEFKKRYDYIFIDTPPIGLVNESIEIINKVDIPLYLIRFNYSRKEFFNTLNDASLLKKNSNLFLVINHYGDGASSYVNYYGGNSYGYGYGYGGKSYGYNSDYHKHTDGYYTEKPKLEVKPTIADRIKEYFNWDL